MVRRAVAAGSVLAVGGVALGQGALRAYEEGLLADAAARTSLLGRGSATAQPFGYMQFRYTWNNRDDDSLSDNATVGFSFPRARIGLKGEVSDEFGYFLLGEFGSSGTFTLFDAYGTYRVNESTTVLFGQMKAPFTREFVTSDTMLQGMERSIVDLVFNAGRAQGVAVAWTGDSFRWWGAVSDGVRTLNTDFTSMGDADVALTARGEWKGAGVWEQFADFTSFPEGTEGLLIGAAAHYQTGGSTVGTADADVFAATVDASYEGGGWNVYGSAHWMHTDPSGMDATDDFGFLVQGGVFLNDSWEAFGRYDVVVPDDDRAGDPDPFNTVTVGVNHYFIPESHAAKLTLDVQVFLDEQSMSIAPVSTLYSLLGSSETGQFAVRGQMQLVY